MMMAYPAGMNAFYRMKELFDRCQNAEEINNVASGLTGLVKKGAMLRFQELNPGKFTDVELIEREEVEETPTEKLATPPEETEDKPT